MYYKKCTMHFFEVSLDFYPINRYERSFILNSFHFDPCKLKHMHIDVHERQILNNIHLESLKSVSEGLILEPLALVAKMAPSLQEQLEKVQQSLETAKNAGSSSLERYEEKVVELERQIKKEESKVKPHPAYVTLLEGIMLGI